MPHEFTHPYILPPDSPLLDAKHKVKRCVFCGGSEHPAYCGYTQAELDAIPPPILWQLGEKLVTWILGREPKCGS